LFKKVENAIAAYTSEIDHSAGGADPEVMLKDRLTLDRDRLDSALEAMFLLCEPVRPPKGELEHSRAIRLNTGLAKKPPECLEYIVVHELAHLIVPSHNARFVPVMNLFMPKWQHYRDELNNLPVRHEDWDD
jgi:hypothetical protein